MRRLKADAGLHARGKPLKAFSGSTSDQMCFEAFGLTYRERLLEVEREVAWQRTRLFNKTTGAVRAPEVEVDIDW
jgi:hypothetical protein